MPVSRGMPIVNIVKVGARSMVLSLFPFFFRFFLLEEEKEGRWWVGGRVPPGCEEKMFFDYLLTLFAHKSRRKLLITAPGTLGQPLITSVQS